MHAKTTQSNIIHKFPLLVALLVIISGVLVLLGWMLDNYTLKSLLPFWLPMKANAALCFVLLGCGIVLSNCESPKYARVCLYSGQGCALLAGLISLLSVAEYAFAVNFGIDELLFRDVIESNAVSSNPLMLNLEEAFPGRIKLEAAVSFVLLAIASIHSDKSHWRIISASFGVFVLSLSLASLSS